jgi:hypothetical protein
MVIVSRVCSTVVAVGGGIDRSRRGRRGREAGAGHHLGGVADLAQVADRRPDHDAAVAEGGAAPDRRREHWGADHDRVLEHGRPRPDPDGSVVGADDRALGEQ